jgi:hypothetical protein
MGAVNFRQARYRLVRAVQPCSPQRARNAQASERDIPARDINIITQHLEIDSEVGYVVLDADLTGHEVKTRSMIFAASTAQ